MPKRKTTAGDEERLSPRERKHLAELGFTGVRAYSAWCMKCGFVPTLDKTAAQMEAEVAALGAAREAHERQSRLHRNPRKLIEEVCLGRMRAKAIDRPGLKSFCETIEKSRTGGDSRRALLRLMMTVHDEADFLFEKARVGGIELPYVLGLIKLNDRRGQWLRPLEQWRPQSHNARRQFASLARHLMASYPVPAFMDQAWLRTGVHSHRMRDWFVHIGAGKNIRTADTPFPLTKLMAHHFLDAPDDISIEGAFRWGQIHALGGDRRLVEAVLGSRVPLDFSDDEFWASVFRFFIANPMLDRRHVGPIVDYLYAQKFQTRDVLADHGRIVVEPPPQPNLSMRGRTADTLLAQVERWHVELGRSASGKGLRFKPTGIKPLEMKTGREGGNVWRIRELLSGDELDAEGRAMRHCVGSYAQSCAAGRCSIWAMELRTPVGLEKRQTIEVSRAGQIVQCRGRLNRLPTASELDLVREWARYAGLSIGAYVRAEG